MADIALTAKITRTLLSLGDLNINNHTTYAIGPTIFGGGRNWVRKSTDSDYVHGEPTISKRLANTTDMLQVYVKGSTMSALDTALGTLNDALAQHRYVLQLYMNGSDHQWDCEAADIVSATSDTAHVYGKIVMVTYQIPHYPIPLVGNL